MIILKLQELIDKQKELNDAIGSYPENPEQLAMAIIESCGKVSAALRPNWQWWSWADADAGEVNRDELIDSLVGVFKFLLVGLICFDSFDDAVTARKYWASDWRERSRYDAGFLSEYATFVEAFPDEDGWQAVAAFIRVCVGVEVTKDEIETAYLKMWERNMARARGQK